MAELSSLSQQSSGSVELSEDELNAVSGGERDYKKEGCYNDFTDFFCYFSDRCGTLINLYYNYPSRDNCPDCGSELYYWDTIYWFECQNFC